MIPRVRKAVFPAAGLGTRFLPATKAQPKEMLPLVDKPLIQYGVEEAMHSGLKNIIIVTGRGKTAIEDHFDVSFELEHLLSSRNKKDLLQTVRAVSEMIDISYVRQKRLSASDTLFCAPRTSSATNPLPSSSPTMSLMPESLVSGNFSISMSSTALLSWP